MKIIVAVKTNRGGTWIVPIVKDLIEHGDDVLCVVADEEGHLDRSLAALGARTMRSASLGGSGLISAALALPQLVRQVRRFDPAVINYHLYRTALVFRLVSVFVPRARRVHAVPGPLFLEQRLVRWIERILARRDSLTICTSDASRRLYRRIGYPDSRMATIAYPIDLGAWKVITPRDRLEARRALGLDLDTFVAVMVAYFYAPRRWVLGGRSVKGHEVALEGWAEFRRRGGEGTLLLVGGGFGEAGDAYRRALLESTGALSDESIRIVETVKDVRPYYAAADVSIAPSRSENLGSAAEASALGVPTIASDVGGLPELVRPSETGWLVQPDDWSGLAEALEQCHAIRDQPVMDEMRLAARRIVDEVTSASHVLPRWRGAIRGDGNAFADTCRNPPTARSGGFQI
jgi:glycosyltransferase involved in cell wall biosynthesis